MAKSYLEPLLAFSGNAFADARSKLVQSLSDDELRTLLQDGSKRCTKRKALEQLTNQMLDHIDAEQRATSELTVRNNSKKPKAGKNRLLINTITDSQHPMQPQPAHAHEAYNPTLSTISGISSQRIQTKRKAAENADPFGVRLLKAVTLNATNDGISNLFNGEEDDDEDWEGMGAKNGPGLQDETPADASANINVIDIRPTTFDIPVLRIGAWIPDDVGLEDWQSLGSLDVGISIHAKFLTYFAFNDTKRATYGAMARNAARYKDGAKCVNMVVWQKGNHRSAFEKAHGNTHRACDTCIRTKRPCVRVVADSSGEKLCVFPLPEVLRECGTLYHIAAWVVGG
ncbi:hypothetical protein J4E90_000011 [Alternaria incomplexa]|uniref:uncharacterized protein n=1 Tax=Alternaria incomplexa TaxID=1187928 RepID=UPI00221E702E|nr:uncharacterized protein J4E90_000011 [Alternaria incomplexa]KAI4921585.1 hypothetical protein J4E90_000011 [Alternaria incomplexa]